MNKSMSGGLQAIIPPLLTKFSYLHTNVTRPMIVKCYVSNLYRLYGKYL